MNRFLPWESLLIKKFEIEKTEPTILYIPTFKTDIILWAYFFHFKHFFINKKCILICYLPSLMKVSVYSGALDIWVSSTSFKKSNIGWLQQQPTEKVPTIHSTKKNSIGHFGARDDQTIRIRNFFEEIEL